MTKHRKVIILIFLMIGLGSLVYAGGEMYHEITIHGKIEGFEYLDCGLFLVPQKISDNDRDFYVSDKIYDLYYQFSNNKWLSPSGRQDQIVKICETIISVEQEGYVFHVTGGYTGELLCDIYFHRQTHQLEEVHFFEGKQSPFYNLVKYFRYLDNGLLDCILVDYGDIQTLEVKCFYDGERHEIEPPYPVYYSNGWVFNIADVWVYDSPENVRLTYRFFISERWGEVVYPQEYEDAVRFFFQKCCEYDDYGNPISCLKNETQEIKAGDFISNSYYTNVLDKNNNWISRECMKYSDYDSDSHIIYTEKRVFP